MLNRSHNFLFATILSLACASVVFSAGYDDCQKAIRDQVKQNNPKVEKTVFHADSEKHNDKSKTETVYTGEGEFLRQSGKWESFTWECTYNPERNTVNTAHYIVRVEPAAGTPVDALKDLVGAKGGQAEGQLTSRGYTYVKTDKSGGNSFTYWREDKTGFCVTIRTADGRYQSIVYATSADCK